MGKFNGRRAEERGYGEKKGNGKGTISSALLFVTLLVNTPRSIALPMRHSTARARGGRLS